MDQQAEQSDQTAPHDAEVSVLGDAPTPDHSAPAAEASMFPDPFGNEPVRPGAGDPQISEDSALFPSPTSVESLEHASARHPARSEGSLPFATDETLHRARGDGLTPSTHAGVVPPLSSEQTCGAEDADDHSYQWHALNDEDENWAPSAPSVDSPTASVVTVVPPTGAERPHAGPALGTDPTSPQVTAEPGDQEYDTSDDREAASGDSEVADESYAADEAVSDVEGEAAAPVDSAGLTDPTDAAAPDALLDYESASDVDSDEDATPVPAASRGGGWSIPVLCAGIGIIACCLLIPLCDSNRRAAYERLRLRRDLESLQHQVATNDEFLHKVAADPTLAERLAQRQMRKIRAGTRILPLNDDPSDRLARSMSPYGIVAVAPPPPLAPYQPVGGEIATLCYNPHTRLLFTGAGLMLLAAGLVMGYGPLKK